MAKKKKNKLSDIFIDENKIIETEIEMVDIIEIDSDEKDSDEKVVLDEIIAINNDSIMKINSVIFTFPRFAHLRENNEEFMNKFYFFIDNIYKNSRNYTFDNYIKRVSNNAIENLIQRYTEL